MTTMGLQVNYLASYNIILIIAGYTVAKLMRVVELGHEKRVKEGRK